MILPDSGISVGITDSQVPDNKSNGGEGGIRTPDTGVSPYNGLANRRLQPLGHLSGVCVYFTTEAFNLRSWFLRIPSGGAVSDLDSRLDSFFLSAGNLPPCVMLRFFSLEDCVSHGERSYRARSGLFQ